MSRRRRRGRGGEKRGDKGGRRRRGRGRRGELWCGE
jgi:hypothetical protein